MKFAEDIKYGGAIDAKGVFGMEERDVQLGKKTFKAVPSMLPTSRKKKLGDFHLSEFQADQHEAISKYGAGLMSRRRKKKTSTHRLVEHLGGALSGHGAAKDHPETQAFMTQIFGNHPEHQQLKDLYFGAKRADDPARHPARIHLPHL